MSHHGDLTERCSVLVWTETAEQRRCLRDGTVKVLEKYYCHQHDPQYLEARRERKQRVAELQDEWVAWTVKRERLALYAYRILTQRDCSGTALDEVRMRIQAHERRRPGGKV